MKFMYLSLKFLIPPFQHGHFTLILALLEF